MVIGRRGQGEGDDNNQAGHIQHSKNRRNYEQRESNRRDKLTNANKKATNQDGNKGNR